MNKQELRLIQKQKRAQLDMEKLSEILVHKLFDTKEYKNSQNIMLYYPLKDEVDLLKLLDDKEKNFFLPKIEGDNLLCCPYAKNDKTFLSCYKTCEPLTKPCNKNLIDAVIVPALAVDGTNYRLGYGGGYYDRFLKDFSGIKIVCIPQALLVESVFPQDFDIRMDVIVTETGVPEKD